jgi:tripartite-type tricarboxylate transporter receptor subunit TctC
MDSPTSLKIRRRTLVALALAATGTLAVPAVAQSGFPSAPLRLVVPYPPGGFTDILGRLIAEKLGQRLGQQVVVDNRGGGGSTIGTAFVARAPADGHTMLLVAPDIAINESLMRGRLSYSALNDFTAVIQAAWSPLVLVAHPSLPVATVADLLTRAKSQPGKINFGSGGNGTGAHLALELLKTRAGVDLVHVPYKGNGPLLTALVGGEVSVAFLQYAVARPQVNAGKLKVLGTPAGRRSPALPDIPTLSESGLPGFDVQPWFGIVAPKATPLEVVARLNREIAAVMREPDVRQQLAASAADAVTSTPEEFGRFIASEVDRWAVVVRESGARVD